MFSQSTGSVYFGLNDRLSAISSCQIGHCLVEVTSTTGRFTICSRCGGCGSRKAVKLACVCSGKLQSRRAREAYSRVFKKGKHPRTNLPLTRSHYSACGNNVSPNQLRSEVDRNRRKRRLTVKTKPWVAAAFGIVEDPPPLSELDDQQGEGEDPMFEDDDFQEEEDPFGFNESTVGAPGVSSSSSYVASTSTPSAASSHTAIPPILINPPTDPISSDEPVAKRACVLDGVIVEENAIIEPTFKKSRPETEVSRGGQVSLEQNVIETSVAIAVTSTDPWEALQERKRRKKNDDRQPTTESEFARLARLAASE